MKRKCVICGTEFDTIKDRHHANAICCSIECSKVRNRNKLRESARKWRSQNPEENKRIQKKYYNTHKEKRLKTIQKLRKEYKFKALQKVCGKENPICENCGCNNFKILEIAHANNDGNIERRKNPHMVGTSIYLAILNGKRQIRDLKVLCKVCNIKDYVEYKFGEKGFKISWNYQNHKV